MAAGIVLARIDEVFLFHTIISSPRHQFRNKTGRQQRGRQDGIQRYFKTENTLWKLTVNIVIEEKEVNLTLAGFALHTLGVSFVSSFKVPLMSVWTNQHLDNLLMCCWEGPLKISTFEKTPRDSHCPQLSPFQQRGKTIQSICPPGWSKHCPPPFSFYYQRLHLCKVLKQMRLCISCFSVAGLKAVFLKGWKTSRDIKESGWRIVGRAGWHEREERLWLRPDDC